MANELPIVWVTSARRCSLSARQKVMPRGREVPVVTEANMQLIQNWCNTNNCGKRVSFDTFQFPNNKLKTAFLLKWGNNDATD